jgi:hypothetical protein
MRTGIATGDNDRFAVLLHGSLGRIEAEGLEGCPNLLNASVIVMVLSLTVNERELACLHGLAEHPRHAELLETAYDEDEDLALDAIDQLQQSVSM